MLQRVSTHSWLAIRGNFKTSRCKFHLRSFRPAPKKDPLPAQVQPVPAKKRTMRTPIIICPSSTQSIITLANIQKLLEQFRYVPHEVRLFLIFQFSHKICRSRKKREELSPKYSLDTNSKSEQFHLKPLATFQRSVNCFSEISF